MPDVISSNVFDSEMRAKCHTGQVSVVGLSYNLDSQFDFLYHEIRKQWPYSPKCTTDIKGDEPIIYSFVFFEIPGH